MMKMIILALSFYASVLAAADAPPMHWKGPVEMQEGFVQDMATQFTRFYGTEVVVESEQGSEGIREVAARAVDAGGAGRKRLTGNPQERLVRQIPVAWDMLVVVTHADNPVSNISLSQLKQILQGKITNWKALGGKDVPIQFLRREDRLSGVAASLRQRLGLDMDQNLAQAQVFADTDKLHEVLQSNPNAIAVESFVIARKLPVKLLQLEGVTPTVAALKAGEYPLYRPLYFTYVSMKNKRLREIKKFLKLAYSAPVKKTMELNGLVPYLDSIKLVSVEKKRAAKPKLVALDSKVAEP